MRLVALVLLAGCGSNAPVTFTTFNAGLATGFVTAAEERSPVTAQAVAALPSDVICVQEVWTPEQVGHLQDAAADAFPHTFFPDARPETRPEPACAPDDISPLVECLDESCADACTDELVDCVMSSCALDFIGLEKSCQGCVQANIGGDVSEIEATCTVEDTRYAYDGSFGTGILSRHPMSDVTERVFDSTTNRRSVLHTVVELPSGPADVYCTHLTAVFGLVPYPRETGSWAEEQQAQIAELLAFVDETSTTGRVALLGDMNTGPDVGDSVAVQPDSWDLFAASDLSAPYVDAEGPCTFCGDNPLIGTGADGEVIDHVFLRGFEGEVTTARVLDDALDTESCGEPLEGAYSDHYGVSVTIAP